MDKVAQKVESYLLESYGLTKMDADEVNVANLADSLSSEDEDGTPLRLPNPQKLFEQLIMDGNSSMPNEVFINLIAAGVNYYEEEVKSAVVDVPIPDGYDWENPRVVVVGDTHGQIEDVLWIMKKYGAPSRQNVYLFNGDICDRGPRALQIWALKKIVKSSKMS